ncbi:hypothetical protein YK48G_22620 [Lentilactobacillus fungorum]|uniref:Uncharacterized protein n=1 Tax=Lentilactobacillus fungorum TaxID=2201250 RepID=A0ABQ3W364_9LACO|nr:hypothetical protein YK48G_22620 [Lentilactobacillus fungorum]
MQLLDTILTIASTLEEETQQIDWKCWCHWGCWEKMIKVTAKLKPIISAVDLENAGMIGLNKLINDG